MLALSLLICVADDPDPKKRDSCYNLSMCHWNLDSFDVQNFSKLALLEVYNKKHSFDIICLSEANVNSAFQYDDERLHLNGLSFARDDNPTNNKRGGTGIYLF